MQRSAQERPGGRSHQRQIVIVSSWRLAIQRIDALKFRIQKYSAAWYHLSVPRKREQSIHLSDSTKWIKMADILWHSEFHKKLGNSWGISKPKYYWAVLLCVLAIDLSLSPSGSEDSTAHRQGKELGENSSMRSTTVSCGFVGCWNVPKIGTFAQENWQLSWGKWGSNMIKSPKLWQL